MGPLMSKPKPPTPLHPSEYEAIEAAMMETARGRWFLKEYTQRNRNADTHVLLDAIGKLQASLPEPKATMEIDRFRMDLVEMSKAILRTRQEIASIKAPDDDGPLLTATEELGSIVQAAEQATHDILHAAEDIQETAWILREQGVDGVACDRLDSRATDIYSACSFQDLTGQRTSKVVHVLRYLEARVNAMIEIWDIEAGEYDAGKLPGARKDGHLLQGPSSDGLVQTDVDELIFIEAPTGNADQDTTAATAAGDEATEVEPEPVIQPEPVEEEHESAIDEPDATQPLQDAESSQIAPSPLDETSLDENTSQFSGADLSASEQQDASQTSQTGAINVTLHIQPTLVEQQSLVQPVEDEPIVETSENFNATDTEAVSGVSSDVHVTEMAKTLQESAEDQLDTPAMKSVADTQSDHIEAQNTSEISTTVAIEDSTPNTQPVQSDLANEETSVQAEQTECTPQGAETNTPSDNEEVRSSTSGFEKPPALSLHSLNTISKDVLFSFPIR